MPVTAIRDHVEHFWLALRGEKTLTRFEVHGRPTVSRLVKFLVSTSRFLPLRIIIWSVDIGTELMLNVN